MNAFVLGRSHCLPAYVQCCGRHLDLPWQVEVEALLTAPGMHHIDATNTYAHSNPHETGHDPRPSNVSVSA